MALACLVAISRRGPDVIIALYFLRSQAYAGRIFFFLSANSVRIKAKTSLTYKYVLATLRCSQQISTNSEVAKYKLLSLMVDKSHNISQHNHHHRLRYLQLFVLHYSFVRIWNIHSQNTAKCCSNHNADIV